MRPYQTRLLASTTLGIAIATLGSATLAQQTQSTPSSPGAQDGGTAQLDEIIVTADRRERRIQDSPTSVSVVSGATLERAQLNGPQDLTQLVPSLTFTSGTAEDGSSLRIRGLGTQVFSIGVEPSVSYVVDGVVLTREVAGLGDLFDIDRVEVLRGPQGTLFGKNASAGVINILTKAPSETLTVTALGLLTDDAERQGRLSVSGPLGDGAGFRLSGFYNERDGHIRNLATGSDTSGSESWGGRARLTFQPSERLSLSAIADYRTSDTTCCQFTARSLTNPTVATLIGVTPGRENRFANVNAPPVSQGKQYGVSLQADYDLGPILLTSITAYRYFDFEANQDIDGLPFANTVVGQNAAFIQLDRNYGRSEADTWTQEIRIASQGSERLDYVAGAFFYDSQLIRDFDRLARVCLVGANATRPVGSDCGAFGRNLPAGFVADVGSRSYAVFGDATLNLAGPLSLIGGLRFNREDLEYTADTFTTAAGATPVTTRFSAGKTTEDDALLGRAGLKWSLGRDANLFAVYSRGYKGPAFDLTTSFTPVIAGEQPVGPETSDAYEVSYKGSLMERRLFLTATLYRTDYEGFQVQAFDPSIAASRLLNAGNVRNEGFELEALYRPDPAFTLSAGYTYSRGRIREFVNGPCYSGQALVQTAARGGAPLQCASNGTTATGDDTQNLSGGRIPNAPDRRWTITARWQPTLEGTTLEPFVQANVVHQSDVIFGLNQNPGTRQEAYSVVNASLGLSDPERGYQFSLFAKNLFDERFVSSIFEAPVNNVAGSFFQILPRDAFRYVGVSLRLSY